MRTICVSLLPVFLLATLALAAEPQTRAPQTGLIADYFAPPLPGENSISNVRVRQDESGTWFADFDYFFTGEPKQVFWHVVAPSARDRITSGGAFQYPISIVRTQRGQQHEHTELQFYGTGNTVTHNVIVAMLKTTGEIIAQQVVAQRIEWPDSSTIELNRALSNSTPAQSVEIATQLIDSDYFISIKQASVVLQRLIQRDPQLEQAYVELARAIMKMDWGAESRLRAEGLLTTALEIKPDSANAKVLMAYVYAHEKRYAEADRMFRSVDSDTQNIWLWTNWGQMLQMQGKPNEAAEKFRKAIAGPPANTTYDRARLGAYLLLVQILEERNDLDEMQALYEKKLGDFGPEKCTAASFADFLLKKRGEWERAIQLANQDLTMRLTCESVDVRGLLAASYYLAWAISASDKKSDLLRKARTFNSPDAELFYLFGTSDKLLVPARALIAAGADVDKVDGEGMTALALALNDRDSAAAARLLKLGASPFARVGDEEMPVAFIPVVMGDLRALKVMLANGVDYRELRFKGKSALEVAESSGHDEIAQLLGRNRTTL